MEIYPTKTLRIVSESHQKLYDRLISMTSGSSLCHPYFYNLYIKCKIKLEHKRSSYYIHKIKGNMGQDDSFNYRNPFEITIEDKEFIVNKGNLTMLEDTLDIIECLAIIQDKPYKKNTTLKYFKPQYPILKEEIYWWFINGCPNKNISYELNIVDNQISILNISVCSILINLLGMKNSFINITDKITGESWTFTDYPYYSYVIDNRFDAVILSSSYYLPGKKCGQSNTKRYSITNEIKNKLETLIVPVQYSLSRVN